MKTIAPDPQLDDELQELYILSKHWVSDIHFEEVEIRFLKKIITNYLLPGLANEQLNEVEQFNKTLAEYDENISCLKVEIAGLLKFIGPIVNESDKKIGMNLIERFSTLEMEMKALFESVKHVKKSLFHFTEAVMRRQGHALINQL